MEVSLTKPDPVFAVVHQPVPRFGIAFEDRLGVGQVQCADLRLQRRVGRRLLGECGDAGQRHRQQEKNARLHGYATMSESACASRMVLSTGLRNFIGQ